MKKRAPGRLQMAVVILAVAVVAVAVLGINITGGSVLGGLPDIKNDNVYMNPLTGKDSLEELPSRPLVVSIDNVGDAVPQSWLSKTDMIYEFPVEGMQTRLQAVFYGEFPEHFGPVRSTRPYFVDLTRELKGIFLAHGWSPDARRYLQSGVVPYINAMDTDCSFYRVSDKSSPHDSYIKWDEVSAKIEEEGWWNERQQIEPFGFLKGATVNEGEPAEKITFVYSGSSFEFTYDSKSGKYKRTLQGRDHVDHETNEPLTASNILVQQVESSVLDQKGRLAIDMCRGGDAVLFNGGVAVKGTWSRKDLDSRTIFKDTEGNEFRLKPGNTWVEVTDQNCEMDYR